MQDFPWRLIIDSTAPTSRTAAAAAGNQVEICLPFQMARWLMFGWLRNATRHSGGKNSSSSWAGFCRLLRLFLDGHHYLIAPMELPRAQRVVALHTKAASSLTRGQNRRLANGSRARALRKSRREAEAKSRDILSSRSCALSPGPRDRFRSLSGELTLLGSHLYRRAVSWPALGAVRLVLISSATC